MQLQVTSEDELIRSNKFLDNGHYGLTKIGCFGANVRLSQDGAGKCMDRSLVGVSGEGFLPPQKPASP
jgi:hypothetical protein